MTDSILASFLIMVAFGLVSAFGAYQWFSAERVRREQQNPVSEPQGESPPF